MTCLVGSSLVLLAFRISRVCQCSERHASSLHAIPARKLQAQLRPRRGRKVPRGEEGNHSGPARNCLGRLAWTPRHSPPRILVCSSVCLLYRRSFNDHNDIETRSATWRISRAARLSSPLLNLRKSMKSSPRYLSRAVVMWTLIPTYSTSGVD